MMRINRKMDYAIRVLLALAKDQGGTGRLSTQKIQTSMLIPRAFLLRIIADLSRAQLIRTYPGPKGGLELNRPVSEITLRTIWEALEGPLIISDCVIHPSDCPFGEKCPVSPHWARIQELILTELDSTSLRILADEANKTESARV